MQVELMFRYYPLHQRQDPHKKKKLTVSFKNGHFKNWQMYLKVFQIHHIGIFLIHAWKIIFLYPPLPQGCSLLSPWFIRFRSVNISALKKEIHPPICTLPTLKRPSFGFLDFHPFFKTLFSVSKKAALIKLYLISYNEFMILRCGSPDYLHSMCIYFIDFLNEYYKLIKSFS